MKKSLLLLVIVLLMSLTAQAQQTFTSDDGVVYTVEKVMDANYPVALAFAPDGRLFYTEKTTGNVRVVGADGVRQQAPVITFEIDALQERGMLGIALAPDFEDSNMLYVVYTAQGTARDYPANTLARFPVTVADNGDTLGGEPEILLSVPIETGSLIHNGGNVHFDDEGYLFLSIGDYDLPANAQDLSVPQGKIHRFVVTDDGIAPAPENPFEDSSIWVYGLRNPFDFAVDPIGGNIFSTENGDYCDDEINLIVGGFHYGQGEDYECGSTASDVDPARYLRPLLSFTPTEAPTGIIVYENESVSAWYGNLFYCVWNDGYPSLRMIELGENRASVERVEEIELGEGRCRIDIAESPSGALYFTTVGGEGGSIWRLVPVMD